jgi:hypothetical protein
MAFMTPEFIKTDWLYVDTVFGSEYIPLADLGLNLSDIEASRSRAVLTGDENSWWREILEENYNFTPVDNLDDIYDVQILPNKFGVRLSASGYLDKTDWCISDRLRSAIEDLIAIYSIDQDEDDPDYEILLDEEKRKTLIREFDPDELSE